MAQQLYKGALKKLEDLSSADWIVGFKEDNGTIAERIVISDFIDVLGLAKASEIKNFAENDLNFTANRTHNLKDKDLIFNNARSIQFRAGLETGATQDTNFTMLNSRVLATFSSTTTKVTSMLNVGGGDASLSYSTATYSQEIQTGSSGNIISSNRAEQAALRIDSTVGGFMGPRVTTVERDAMVPVASWLVYNTNDNEYQFYDGTTWISAAGSLSGSGTNNYLARWTPDGATLGDSIIQDDGTSIGIGTSPNSTGYITITQSSHTYGMILTQSYSDSNPHWGIAVQNNTASLGTKTGFKSIVQNGSDLNIGYDASVTPSATSSGAIGYNASITANTTGDVFGAKFSVSNSGSGNAYAINLSDGTEGYGKVLTSDANGNGSWQAASGGNTIYTADDSLTGTRTVNFNGNDLIFKTSASNRFRIWNGAGSINDSLSMWDGGSGNMAMSFYNLVLKGNATNDCVKFFYNGETSFAEDVRIGNSAVLLPAVGTKLHITGNGATSATTSLLVENSAATQLLKIDDAGGFALGSGAIYGNANCVAIGANADAEDNSSPTISKLIAIGADSYANGSGSVSLGVESSSNSQSISVGFSSFSQFSSTAIGYNANASNTGVALGHSANSSNTRAIAIGNSSTSSRFGGLAIGYTANVGTSGNYGMALGAGANVTAGNSILLSTKGTTQTNSTANTFEVNLNNATTSVFRFGNTVDGWLNSTGNFGIGLNTGISEKLHVSGNLRIDGQMYSSIQTTKTPTGTTETIDWNDGNFSVLDLGSATGDVTLTLSNPKAGASYFIKIIQGATARDVIFGSNVLFAGQTAPYTLDVTTTNDSIDAVALTYDGTNYIANFSQNHA